MKKISVLCSAILLLVLSVNTKVMGEQDGKAVFEKNCKMCHGADGKGNSKMASAMKLDPMKLNLIKNETVIKNDSELIKIISDGLPKMKGFKGKLKPEDIASTVKYIRFLAKQEVDK